MWKTIDGSKVESERQRLYIIQKKLGRGGGSVFVSVSRKALGSDSQIVPFLCIVEKMTIKEFETTQMYNCNESDRKNRMNLTQLGGGAGGG